MRAFHGGGADLFATGRVPPGSAAPPAEDSWVYSLPSGPFTAVPLTALRRPQRRRPRDRALDAGRAVGDRRATGAVVDFAASPCLVIPALVISALWYPPAEYPLPPRTRQNRGRGQLRPEQRQGRSQLPD